jgi:ATP-dependent RNA helicase A
MSPATAAHVVALRPALEALMVKATTDPASLEEPQDLDAELMTIVRALSKPNAARYGLKDENPGER